MREQHEHTKALALRPREASAALGVCLRTLHQWTKEGRIPHVRMGGGKKAVILYPVTLLEQWLRDMAHETTEGPADE